MTRNRTQGFRQKLFHNLIGYKLCGAPRDVWVLIIEYLGLVDILSLTCVCQDSYVMTKWKIEKLNNDWNAFIKCISRRDSIFRIKYGKSKYIVQNENGWKNYVVYKIISDNADFVVGAGNLVGKYIDGELEIGINQAVTISNYREKFVRRMRFDFSIYFPKQRKKMPKWQRLMNFTNIGRFMYFVKRSVVYLPNNDDIINVKLTSLYETSKLYMLKIMFNIGCKRVIGQIYEIYAASVSTAEMLFKHFERVIEFVDQNSLRILILLIISIQSALIFSSIILVYCHEQTYMLGRENLI